MSLLTFIPTTLFLTNKLCEFYIRHSVRIIEIVNEATILSSDQKSIIFNFLTSVPVACAVIKTLNDSL